MKQKIEIVVFQGNLEDEIPEHPAQFILFWQEKINQIPVEFKPHAKITIESSTEYDYCSDLLVKIVYERMETDDEESFRLKNRERQLDDKKNHDLATLDRLLKEYPDRK